MQWNPSTTEWLTWHGLVTVVAVLVYVISAQWTHQRRHPTAAIAWILFILLVPYLALPAFLAFGTRKLPRPAAGIRSSPRVPQTTDAWAIETLLALDQPAPASYAALHLHANGHAAKLALLDIIDNAQVSIDLCTFMLGRDELGRMVLNHLSARAREGVRVRLLLDGMGNLMAGRPRLTQLTEAGGSVALFVPPLKSPIKGRTNLRNHRKLLVTDAGTSQARLWLGGRNLADEYFEGRADHPAWRDLSLDLQGALVAQAHALFERDWAFAQGTALGLASTGTPLNSDFEPGALTLDGGQLVASGPDQVDDNLHALLVTAAYRARRRIALATPYFVPEQTLLMALCMAARRGVVVDLLLPAHSNHVLSDLARGRALRALAQAGGRVWLMPGMLHAKLAVIDEVLALAGSANLDSRSLFLNYELMLAFHKVSDVRHFEDWFDAERSNALAYRMAPISMWRDLCEGMILWLGFQL
jgi:cardiolipin synthase A/B